ncbi:hypothetical protein LHYA1_G007970 [Lachnellula hyalina]|uniref:TPR domain protein n=1 Tax=Lachnellula hyalina TaxID=1316788 RepID=A0A8H8QZD6_9HELO|nr:uncharacterized protein LHYA1_G007970 [Lachnellula hyalina]TVY24094.1 hypothetical protein LHYA1_G007970 [Lachnellula hyalina]
MSLELDPASTYPNYNLGSYSRPITTSSHLAQTHFTNGLIWSYAFNHSEAATCFTLATRADPTCAMAYWGLAYAMGPNYNKPWEYVSSPELEQAQAAAKKAKELVMLDGVNVEPVERAIIEALQHRYHVDVQLEMRNKAYSSAMEQVHADFPEDLDVCALYADALMNLTPWALWDLPTGLPSPGASTLTIKSTLETACSLPGGLQHPSLLHLYIHLMEMSPHPEIALRHANKLRDLVPDAGHLQHMPTHIDILCGDYASTISSNWAAVLADEKYFSQPRDGGESGGGFYTLYRIHNHHFKIYAAMFAAQSHVALTTVHDLENILKEEVIQSMPDFLEGFGGIGVHVLVRFGRWADLSTLPLPANQDLYRVTTAMIHYGHGVAFAATGRIQESAKEQELFRQAVLRVPESRTLFNNKCIDILAIAAAMLDGELEYRRGNFDAAFSYLKRAVELGDALPYDEPWGWMQPTRHAYGALLLEQGKTTEALQVYAADLGFDDSVPRPLRHLNNVWALSGYHECLGRLGMDSEARNLEPLLRKAVDGADIPIKSSCFCRLTEAKVAK